jgi:hypothetical protein
MKLGTMQGAVHEKVGPGFAQEAQLLLRQRRNPLLQKAACCIDQHGLQF